MGGLCSRRREPVPDFADVVVCGVGGLTVKMQVGTRYKTGAELRERVAALFHMPYSEAVLMCRGVKVEDEELLLETRTSALLAEPPQLQLIRARKHMAVSATAGGAMTIWDVERGEVAKALPSEHLSCIWCLEVNWETQRCVTGSDDKTLKIWDIDRERTTSLRDHGDAVTCCSVDWDKCVLISGSMDKTLKKWCMKKYDVLHTFEGHGDGVQCLSVDWGNQCALSGSWDKTLKLWELEGNTCTKTLEGHDSYIICVEVDWTARRALSGARGSDKYRAPRSYERLNPGGSPNKENNLKLWDLDEGVCLKTMQGHELDILGLAFDWASKRGISTSTDRLIKMWNLETGECVLTFTGHNDCVSCIKVDWKARRALTGAGDNELRIWDIDNAECITTWAWNGHEVRMGRGQIKVVALEPFPISAM